MNQEPVQSSKAEISEDFFQSKQLFSTEHLLKKITGWKLGIRRSPEKMLFCLPEDMANRTIKENPDGMVNVVWSGHVEFGANFQVTVSWNRDENAYFSGYLSYSGYSGEYMVEEIHFPIIKLTMKQDSEFLSACWDMGIVFRGEQLEPARKGNGLRRDYRAMQFSALMNREGASIYFDHRDSEWNAKSFEFKISEDGNNAWYSGIHYVANGSSPAVAYKIPYPSGCMAFNGGWFEAAQIYKPWAAMQSWNCLRGNKNRLRDIGLWVWNRGKAEAVIPPVKQLQQDCGDVPVALDWYWWHQCPYDTDYPHYWPPREGEDVFRAAIADLKQHRIFSQVYVNGICWDVDNPKDKEEDLAGIRFDNHGEPMTQEFNHYTHHRLGFMCGEAPEFQNKIIEVVGKLYEAGLDGQYLDMIGGASQMVCFNPAHQHSRGGGNHGVSGYRTLLKRLRQKYPAMPLSTEYCNEAFMDLVDGVIICGSVSAEHLGYDYDVVPLFSSVYSGRLALFGSFALPDNIPPWDPLWPEEDRWPEDKEQEWHRLFPDQFYIEFARSVLWGAQPMVCNLKAHFATDPKFKKIYEFIVDTAKFYYEWRDYLFDGEMLSPGIFECRQKEVAFMSRMIFTKEADCRTIRKSLPTILHSCWRSPAGDKALFAVNYTANKQKWRYQNRDGVMPPHSWLKLPLDG